MKKVKALTGVLLGTLFMSMTTGVYASEIDHIDEGWPGTGESLTGNLFFDAKGKNVGGYR